MDKDILKLGIALFLVALGLLTLWHRRHFWIILPGPRGWPYIGNALQMDPNCPHMTLSNWSKKYGDMYTITLFGKPIVVVSGENEIREVLVKKSREFAGRPQVFRKHFMHEKLQGVASISYSQCWQARKKLLSNKLRMYGDGLKHLEQITTDILKDFIQVWELKKDKPFDPREDIHHAIISILFCLTVGRKLDKSDPLMDHITYYETVLAPEIHSSTTGVELDLIPWLRFFGHDTFKKLKDFRDTYVLTIIRQLIEDEKKTLDPANPRGLLDDLLHELSRIKESSGQEGNDVLNETSIIPYLVSEVLAAGTQTTSSTLLSFIGLCIIHQDFQERLRMHINDAINDRTPQLEDRPQLPLVEASLLEVLRLTSVIPTGIPHETIQATSIGGISLPKGSAVWVNLWGLHHDERYWEDPWTFNPDRFLDSHGHLLPAEHPCRKRIFFFGAGQRVCVGEALARNRLFLFVTSLIQHFKFLPGCDPPNCDPRDQSPGLVIYPPSFSIKLETI